MKRWVVLEGLVKEHGWKRGAEIGVLNGATTFHLLKRCPDLHLIAVDQWSLDDTVYGDLTDVGVAFVKKARSAFEKRCRILLGPSADMAHNIEDGSLDFCFIDADHSYESALADIKAWAPKVRPGGAVMGHDIDYATVAQAVSETFGSWETLPDDIWMVRT